MVEPFLPDKADEEDTDNSEDDLEDVALVMQQLASMKKVPLVFPKDMFPIEAVLPTSFYTKVRIP